MQKIRLDLLVSKKFNISRNQAIKAIENNLIYINNTFINKKNLLYCENSIIEMKENFMEKPMIDYLEVNDNFIILNKPFSLCCARNINTEKNHYVLNELVKEKYSLSDSIRPEEFGLVHRLDKDTEGIMILSRNNEYYNILINEFSENKVKKTYLAIVCIEELNVKSEDTVYFNLIYGKDKVLVNNKNSDGLLSITSYKIIKEYTKNNKKFALVEVKPITGRRHQIRSVLSYLKMPIIGDNLYGRNEPFHRMCLYSSILSIESLNIHYSLYNQHIHDINNLLMYILLS